MALEDEELLRDPKPADKRKKVPIIVPLSTFLTALSPLFLFSFAFALSLSLSLAVSFSFFLSLSLSLSLFAAHITFILLYILHKKPKNS